MITVEISDFLRKETVSRFLDYVRVDTRSDAQADSFPSTPGQMELARRLERELRDMGIHDTTLDPNGYLYARVPAHPTATGPPLSFCAHLDTSPSESGRDVKPIRHRYRPGQAIRFPDNPRLQLSVDDAPEQAAFGGSSIITASGSTLLGADDKAGCAEIMAALAAMRRFAHLAHPELRLVFTPDEEIGRGADRIDLNRLGKVGYTVDGGMMGHLETECFDARQARLVFHGRNIHPGYAKDRMVNAAAVAARFVAALPEHATPEHTEKREGFWHLTHIGGDENQAEIKLLVRDFDTDGNDRRLSVLQKLLELFEQRYPGLTIELIVKEQYRNMREVLAGHPDVVEKARTAIAAAGLSPVETPIRGGTDGARISFMGMPCPNLFTGGMHFHSKTEWIPEFAMEKAAEVIVRLCGLWAAADSPKPSAHGGERVAFASERAANDTAKKQGD